MHVRLRTDVLIKSLTCLYRELTYILGFHRTTFQQKLFPVSDIPILDKFLQKTRDWFYSRKLGLIAICHDCFEKLMEAMMGF